jgi:oligoribonuclease NrnB/cAMP/cGMP phosphodiesterase (DHH superfamily)
MVGIYHRSDFDGFASAAIIRKAYPEVRLIGYDYSDTFDINCIEEGETVIMSDISFEMNIMEAISKRTNGDFTWIDHHISKINEYNEYIKTNSFECKTVLLNGTAACVLTWMHLFPLEKVPDGIKLLGEYDVWKKYDGEFDWEKEILPFQYGIKLRSTCVDDFPIDLLTQSMYYIDLVYEIIEEGKNILKYQRQHDAKSCGDSFEINFHGFRAICLNTTEFSSNVFNSVYDESKHDIMMPFKYTGHHWKFSLYTTKDNIDCSAIAQWYGGGGHRAASGMTIDDIKIIFPDMK